jgi:tetratricopeptide (TPR) repeat protein
MNFLKKFFVRRPEDFLAKGDGLFASGSFFEARSAYEDGVQCCEPGELKTTLHGKIAEANCSLATLNIEEAGHALARGATDKAREHLELAKTLTDDACIREKAEVMLSELTEKPNDQAPLQQHSSCSSCSNISEDPHAAVISADVNLDPHEHYELLIHQLPEEMYGRYAQLGEDFAGMFIAASLDHHKEALALLEKWFNGPDRDIYCYEKGKILHRLGNTSESEACMLESISLASDNPLPHLGLALLLIEEHRLKEALQHVEAMIAADIFTGQALMMRAEIFELAGDLETAIKLYGELLDTPLSKSAAEKLFTILNATNRQAEAAHIFKRYLGSCKH